MSTTIDEKVVEMRFDNKNFESNVSTTMSTLDKLKQKLSFSGASKGFEDLGSAANKIDMSGLSGSIDSIGSSFSAMEVVAVTALATITNKAVEAGLQLAKSLSIDQISAGWTKYSDKTVSVATLTAQGYDIDEVSDQLSRLNTFTDETSYNFTEMVSNIAKFTATGQGLEDSVTAMEGIATWAALSGQNATTASNAMYQLSQAMGSGLMRKEDYKSIQNASMDTEEFRQKCLDAGVALGTLRKNADDTYTSLVADKGDFTISQFADHLTQDAWFTSDVMMSVFNTYSSAVNAICDAAEESDRLVSEVIDEIHDKADELKTDVMTDEEAVDAAIKELGYTLEDGTLLFDSFGLKAFEAAQKARTFSDAIGSVKDAVSTGWMNTFEIIFGDAEQATELWTDLANLLWDIFAAGGEIRNAILESALGRSFQALGEQIQSIMRPLDSVNEAVGAVTSSLKDYSTLVDEIIRGEWGNAPSRWQDLTAAGYDWAYAQNLVNERLGDSTRHATDYVEGQDQMTSSTQASTKALSEWTDTEYESLEALIAMSDEELRALGYTEEQIAAFRELEALAKKLGLSIRDLLSNIDEINGRWLLLEGIKNIGRSIGQVFTALKNAWQETFTALNQDNIADMLFEAIAALHRFSVGLLERAEANADKMVRTFKGLFSILKLVTTLVGGPLKIAFKLITALLKALDINIWDITAVVGDAIVNFEQWLTGLLDFDGAFEGIISGIKEGIGAIREWISANLDFMSVVETVKSVFQSITRRFSSWIDSLKDAEDLPKAIAEGIVNGFKSIPKYIGIILQSIKDMFTGAFDGLSFDIDPDSFVGKLINGFKIAGQVIVELGKILLGKVNSVLSAHGFNEISLDAIAGLVNGLKGGASKVWDAIVEIATNLIQKFKDILGIHSPSTVFMALGGFIIGGLVMGLLNGSSSISETFQNVFSGVIEFIKSIDWGALITTGFGAGLLVIASKLSISLGQLTSALQNFGWSAYDFSVGIKKYFKASAMEKRSEAVLNLAKALIILVAAVVVLTLIPQEKLWSAIGALGALIGMIVALSVAAALIGKTSGTLNQLGLSGALLGIAAALLILAIAMKSLSKIENADAAIDMLFTMVVDLLAVLAAVGVLVKYTGMSGSVGKIGTMLLLMSVALLIMVKVMKQIAKMDASDIGKGLIVIAALEALMVGLIAVTKLFNDTLTNPGTVLLAVAAAILVLVIVIKLVAGMRPEDLTKGIAVVILLSAVIVGLMAATKLFAGEGAKVGATLLAMSVAILLLAGVVRLMGGMDVNEMFKGLAAVVILGAVIVMLVKATAAAGGDQLTKVAGRIIAMTLAIAVMAIAAALLGLINIANLAKGVIAVAILSAMMVAMMAASKNVTSATGSLIAMTVAIAVLAAAVAALSFIDTTKLAVATGAMTVLMAMMIAMMAVSKKVGGSIGSLIVMTVAIAVMAAAIAALSFIPDTTKLAAAAGAMAVLMGMFGVMALLAKSTKGSIGTLVALAVIVALLAGVLYALSSLPVESVVGSAAALTVLLLSVAAVLVVLGKISINAGDALVGIILLTLMAVPLLAFVGVLALMQNINNAVKNATVLAALAVALTVLLIPLMAIGALVAATGGVLLLTAVGSLLAMAVPLVAFVGILALMQNITNAEANAKLLIKLMTVMTSILIILAVIGPFALIGVAAMTALTALIVAIGALAVGVGALMEKFPQLEDFLDKGIPILEKIAYAIGSLVGNLIAGFVDTVLYLLPAVGTALSDFMINATPFIEGIKMVDASILEGVGTLTAAILALTAASFLAGIADLMTFGTGSLSNVGDELGKFMTSALPFVDGAKLIKPESLEGVQALADMILILTKANLVETLTSWLPKSSSLSEFGEQFEGLGASLTKLANECPTLEQSELVVKAADAIKAMSDAADGIDGQSDFSKWLTGDNSIKTFVTEIGECIDSLSGIGTFSAAQATTVRRAANAIGVMIDAAGEIDGQSGFSKWLTGDNSISAFTEEILGFITNCTHMGRFGAQQKDSIMYAADAIKAMTDAASGINGQTEFGKWLTGDASISTFAQEIVKFITNCSKMVTFTEKQKQSVEYAADAIKAMTDAASGIEGQAGWSKSLFGDNSLTTFAQEIVGFITNCSFMPAFTKEQKQSVEYAADAVKAMADVADAIPNEGGILATWIGDNTLSSFGAGIASFIDAVVNTGIFTEEQKQSVEYAADAIATMADVADSIPNEGGILATWIGDNTLSSFGAGIHAFISQIRLAGSFTEEHKQNVQYAADAVKIMVDAAKEINGQADWSKTVFGDDSLTAFAEDLTSFIETCSGMGTFSHAKKLSVQYAADAVKVMVDAASGIDGQTGFSKWLTGDNSLTAFAKDIKGFVEVLDDLDTVVITDLGDTLEKLGKTTIEYFIDGFEGAETKVTDAVNKLVQIATDGIGNKIDEFKKSGKKSAENYVDGLEDEASDAETAAKTMASNAADAIKEKYSSFKSAGQYLAEGLISGINAKKQDVYNAAYALGQKAVQGEKDGQKSNSPSKLTIQAGKWIGEGLIIGMQQMSRKVYDSGDNLGSTLTNSISSAVQNASDSIDTDIETQPIISPVLDLSNVKSGADKLATLFSNGPSVGVTANVGAIATAMSRRNQNGANDDVVSELVKLGKQLENVGGDSYSVGSVNYQEGSDVAEALKTIIRAATVERRS